MTSSTAPSPVTPPGEFPPAPQLDLPAKVRLLTGASAFTLHEEPRLGLRETRLSDGPTGVRGLRFHGGRISSLFPNATLLASSWDEDLMTEVGRLLAEEAMAQQIHVVLGPTINLHRTPLGGRLFEAFSEDPLLTGKLAAAYVRGLQGSGVAACLKHLVANESETERNTVDSVVDEATLRELYLLPFEIAVTESRPWSVMAAYNRVNGVPATEHHHVINEVLKGEWGWDGVVMSDWYATTSALPAANGGLDLVMPGPDGPWGQALVDAVRAGEVEERVIDDHVERLLRLATRVGSLGPERAYPQDLPTPTSDTRREQLTRLAAAGMTVLSNRDQVLPLQRTSRIALIGRHAVETIDMGGGSAQVNPPHQVSVAEGLTAAIDTRGSVSVTDGVEVRTRLVPARPTFVTDPESGEPGVHFTLLADDGTVIEERQSPQGTTLIGVDDDLSRPVREVLVRARIQCSGPVEVGAYGVGSWELTVGDERLATALSTSGGGIGEDILAPPSQTITVADVGDGVVRARVTVPTSTQPLWQHEDGEAIASPAMPGVHYLGLVARPAPQEQDHVIAAAASAAAEADVAVVVVGLTEEQETEAVDKSTLRLPGRQDELVHAVAASARRTVVVVNAATPVLMPWRDQVDAILWAGLPGQEGGHAVAAALLGDIEPAGRLVTTFPAADGASPAWSVTPRDGRVAYQEGTWIGHRGHFAGMAPEPAFWFGHGLGLGAWEYSDVRLVEDGAGTPVEVELLVTNTGGRRSREVVQVYFEPAEQGQPVRLVGWASVLAEAGERQQVAVPLEARMWRRWDPAVSGWGTVADGGRLLVARGLGDIRAELPVVGSRTAGSDA